MVSEKKGIIMAQNNYHDKERSLELLQKEIDRERKKELNAKKADRLPFSIAPEQSTAILDCSRAASTIWIFGNAYYGERYG